MINQETCSRPVDDEREGSKGRTVWKRIREKEGMRKFSTMVRKPICEGQL